MYNHIILIFFYIQDDDEVNETDEHQCDSPS